MLFKISSFGDVAISSSKGDRILAAAGTTGTEATSFGTILNIVPSGIFSTLFPILHFFVLGICPDEGVVADEAIANAVAAKGCVGGAGVSVPLRLNMERLRRLMPFWLGWISTGDDVVAMVGVGLVSRGSSIRYSSCKKRAKQHWNQLAETDKAEGLTGE
jgi:hypothetical protein